MREILLVTIFLAIQTSWGFPQGLFSQGISLPRFVQWDSKPQFIKLPLNINFELGVRSSEQERPIKTSFLNIFGKKNTDNLGNQSNKQQQHSHQVNGDLNNEFNEGQNSLTTEKYYFKMTNLMTKQNDKDKKTSDRTIETTQNSLDIMHFKEEEKEEELVSKFGFNDNSDNEISYTDNITNENSDTEATTEYTTETTTDDYESTTFDHGPLNRSGASPALVASLLG